jgi:hypothetical protein
MIRTITPNPASPSSLRVRRFRERRRNGLRLFTVTSERRRNGLRLFTVTIPETAIENAIARVLLAAERSRQAVALTINVLPDRCEQFNWTVLKTWQVGGVSDSIGSMDSELNRCEANGGFLTSMIG